MRRNPLVKHRRFQMKFSLITASLAGAICVSVHLNILAATKSNQSSNIEKITVLGNANTTGANLGGIELKSLPLNSHVVGRAEIERLRFVDPDEFLDRIPGETQVRNLRIPDGGKGYTIPMLDGMPLENPYEGATQRLTRTNTFDIERVEVIKGPTSALFPNNALGGIVNVVSRDTQIQQKSMISLEAGDFNRFRGNISTVGSKDIGEQAFAYSFNANTRQLDGLREFSKNDRDQASTKLRYDLSDNTHITARLEWLEEVTNARGDLSQAQIDEDPKQAGSLSASTDLSQNTLALALSHTLTSGAFEMALVRREKDTVGASRFRGPQDENDIGYSAKLQYRHTLNKGNIIGGYQSYNGTQDTRQYDRSDIDLAGEFVEFTNTLGIHAYYLQYQYDPNERLTLTLGGRHEDITLSSSENTGQLGATQSQNFNDFAPKFGLTYQVQENHMLWFSLAEGFYAPDATDLFDLDNGNTALKPEQALNHEIGLRGDVGDWHYDSSAYYMDIKDYLVTQEFMDSDGNEVERTNNAGKVSIKGIESVVEYAPKGTRWRVGITHTYTQNTYDSFVQSSIGAPDDLSGKVLRRSPKHHLNARLAWLPNEDLSIELEGDFYTSYFSDNANSPEGKYTRPERINLRLDYQIAQWRIWLHALNLTNTMEDRATFSRGTLRFRTIDGRTLYAGTSVTF